MGWCHPHRGCRAILMDLVKQVYHVWAGVILTAVVEQFPYPGKILRIICLVLLFIIETCCAAVIYSHALFPHMYAFYFSSCNTCDIGREIRAQGDTRLNREYDLILDIWSTDFFSQIDCYRFPGYFHRSTSHIIFPDTSVDLRDKAKVFRGCILSPLAASPQSPQASRLSKCISA